MRLLTLTIAAALTLGPVVAHGADLWGVGKQVAGSTASGTLEKELNKRLLEESRKNQCSFKTDSDELQKGCDPKARRLAEAVVDAKKRLEQAGVRSFKFEVSGHTDSSGSAAHNKDLSLKRAERIRKELAARGVPAGDVVAVGAGSERPLVKPDDTASKKAKNRRYEVQIRL